MGRIAPSTRCYRAAGLGLPTWLLIIPLVVAVPASGLADDKAIERAKIHYKAGAQYYEEEKFKEALDEFKQSYSNAPAARLLYNIGLCHEKLGNLSEAVDYLHRFEVSLPFNDQRKQVKAHIAEIKARMKTRPASKKKEEAKPTRSRPVDSEAGRTWRWTSGWVAVGVGVAALGAGVAMGVLAGKEADAYAEAVDAHKTHCSGSVET